MQDQLENVTSTDQVYMVAQDANLGRTNYTPLLCRIPGAQLPPNDMNKASVSVGKLSSMSLCRFAAGKLYQWYN